MNHFLSFLITALCFFVFCYIYWRVVNKTRRPEKAPKHKPTMFDVRRFLKEGNKQAAIRLYIQIFKVSSKQAHKDVEELQRSLEV